MFHIFPERNTCTWLSAVFQSFTIALGLCILISLPASGAPGKWTLQKIIIVQVLDKNELKLNRNCDIAQKLDFSSIIDSFVKQKAQKHLLNNND